MTTLFIDWQPSIEAFSIGSFSVRWYSLLWCVGLLLAYLIVQRLYRQQKIEDEKFEPLFFYCFLFRGRKTSVDNTHNPFRPFTNLDVPTAKPSRFVSVIFFVFKN